MKTKCEICGKLFDKKNEKGMQYIPDVCSSECFIQKLNVLSLGIWATPAVTGIFRQIKYQFPKRDFQGRSKYEERFVKWMDEVKIYWLYEPFICILKNEHYLPDFFLPFERVFIEVKGIWEGKAYTKFKHFDEEANFPIFLITDSFLRRLEKTII